MHAPRHVAHVHRACGAVEFGQAPRVILELPEVGQQLAEGPAGIARRAPVVEVRGLSAHVHHGVDGARPAQYLAARPEGAARYWAGRAPSTPWCTCADRSEEHTSELQS